MNESMLEGRYNIPWLVGKKDPELDVILPLGTEVFLKKNAVLRMPGERYTSLYLLMDGLLRASSVKKNGELLPRWIACPGCVIGEYSVFTAHPSLLHISAIAESRLISFSLQLMLKEILPKHPKLSMVIMESMAVKRYMMASRTSNEIVVKQSGRVALFIYFCTSKVWGERTAFIKLTNEGIADLLNIRKDVVTKTINLLIKKNILCLRDEQIQVLDREHLALIAFGEEEKKRALSAAR